MIATSGVCRPLELRPNARARLFSRALTVLALLTCSLAHCAEEAWNGVVTHVIDGDSLRVRPSGGGKPRSVRLVGIDAPEICQAKGEESRRALVAYVLRQPVSVFILRQDDYGRDLARVHSGQQDVGLWMVSQGQAWSYRYKNDTGPYGRAERAARLERRGLFADASAEEPRTFRRRHGRCVRERRSVGLS